MRSGDSSHIACIKFNNETLSLLLNWSARWVQSLMIPLGLTIVRKIYEKYSRQDVPSLISNSTASFAFSTDSSMFFILTFGSPATCRNAIDKFRNAILSLDYLERQKVWCFTLSLIHGCLCYINLSKVFSDRLTINPCAPIPLCTTA